MSRNAFTGKRPRAQAEQLVPCFSAGVARRYDPASSRRSTAVVRKRTAVSSGSSGGLAFGQTTRPAEAPGARTTTFAASAEAAASATIAHPSLIRDDLLIVSCPYHRQERANV